MFDQKSIEMFEVERVMREWLLAAPYYGLLVFREQLSRAVMIQCTRVSRSCLAVVLFGLSSLLLPSVSNADTISDLLSTEQNEESAPAERSIDLQTGAETDENIRKRLKGIYVELDTLAKIDVLVTNGIVTLTGPVASSQANERATEIASQVEGVVEVVDKLTIDTNVGRRIESTVDRTQASFVALVASLPVLLLALLILVAFWFLGRWIGNRRGVFRAIAPNTFIADLLSLLARGAIVLAGLILALTLLDATSIIGSVLGAAGIVGLALGFAVRDTVENFIASILLSLRTPFITRDYVKIGDHEGTVARLTSRATILISQDGNQLRVPNALVYKAVIINFTRQPERRFEFSVGVDTDLDLNMAQQSALDTVHGVEGVLSDPSATVLVSNLGDSNVSLTVRAWIDQRSSDILKVRSEAIRYVKQAFDEAGIAMPEPIYRVRFQEGLVNIGTELASTAADQSAKATETTTSAATRNPLADSYRDEIESNRGGDGESTAPPGSTSTKACDTSSDDSANRSLERELSDSDTENLLNSASRME